MSSLLPPFWDDDDERGAFGLVDGLLAVAIVALTLGTLSAIVTRSGTLHYGTLQTERRIEAANAAVDLQAIGAYDRSPYSAIAAAGGTHASAFALPTLTPFAGAAALVAATAAPALAISASEYDETSGRLLGEIDMPAAGGVPGLHVPIALVQATSGIADCPEALKGVAGTAC